MNQEKQVYGVADASYQAAGGIEGIQKLVNRFYDLMDSVPESAEIRALHKQDLGEARQRLAWFLSGWLGGPKLYQQHVGCISIPGFHRRFDIGQSGKDAWLDCMARAIDEQDYSEEFKRYLLYQLSIPAERCRVRN